MKLKKELNGLDVFSIAAGSMISSGLFVLPAIAYRSAGAGILISYLFAGLIMLPALLSQLELATAIPKAGGAYFYAERILGTSAGVVAGFANWFSISLKSAFALIGIGAFAVFLSPGISEFHIKLIAGGATIFFALINLVSVKSSGKLQVFLVAGLLLILSAFVIYGYKILDFSRFSELSDIKWQEIFSTTGMVFISYGGLTKIASIAEEVKNPQKNLVRGSIAAFIVVQIFYLAVIFVIIGVLPKEKMLSTLTPVSDTGYFFAPGKPLGNIFLVITAIAAMLAFITTANAGIMTSSRVPLAMSRDGLLPSCFCMSTKKNKNPYISIVFTALFMLLIILVVDIKNLAKVASLFMILLFLLVNLSVIIIRESKISNYKPSFKSPFYPFIQIVGIIIYLFLIIEMGFFTIIVASVFILVSLAWYFIYSRNKVKRKSAFVHMVENLTSKELVGQEKELESELLDILIERNDIVEDRFDKIIRQASVLDLDRTIDRDELFKIIAENVEEKWGISKDDIEKKLNIREDEASTLIYPGVAVPHAIPHVIIKGRHKFDIVLVRNKYGIKWNEQNEVVYTAFCLIGSKDERNFHLRALMYIAQILQDPNFHTEWMNAKDENELRSVILLTKRRRT